MPSKKTSASCAVSAWVSSGCAGDTTSAVAGAMGVAGPVTAGAATAIPAANIASATVAAAHRDIIASSPDRYLDYPTKLRGKTLRRAHSARHARDRAKETAARRDRRCRK